MKLQDAIAQIDHLRPHGFDDVTLTRWISDLDAQIYSEYIKNHEGTEGIAHGSYDSENDMGTELLVPSPYDDLYIKYLMVQIDFHNADIAKYNNSMMMYNTALSAYIDHFNRENLPKQGAVISI